MTVRFSIGVLARETGIKVPTIRYYEQIGLLPEPARTEGNQRRYGVDHRDRLNFIRHGRDLGFSLDALRSLLSFTDNPGQCCAQIDEIARRNLEDIEKRIARLEALREELSHMIAQCAGGKVETCRIIEALSDYSACGSDRHR